MNKKVLYLTTAAMIIVAIAGGSFMLKQAEKMSSAAKARKQSASTESADSNKEPAKSYLIQAGNPGIVSVSVKKNGLIDIFDPEEPITLPSDSLYNDAEKTARNPLLKGKPMRYNRFKANGMTFEWIVSSYKDANSTFMEDAALIISGGSGTDSIQSIKPNAKGAGGIVPALENKFLFADVNFDGLPDLLINTGSHGSQMAARYYCFINTGLDKGRKFNEAAEFTEILNPEIDATDKLIRSQSRSNASEYITREYKYENGKFVLNAEWIEDMPKSGKR